MLYDDVRRLMHYHYYHNLVHLFYRCQHGVSKFRWPVSNRQCPNHSGWYSTLNKIVQGPESGNWLEYVWTHCLTVTYWSTGCRCQIKSLESMLSYGLGLGLAATVWCMWHCRLGLTESIVSTGLSQHIIGPTATTLWTPRLTTIKQYQSNHESSFERGHQILNLFEIHPRSEHTKDSRWRFNALNNALSWQNVTLNHIESCNGCNGSSVEFYR